MTYTRETGGTTPKCRNGITCGRTFIAEAAALTDPRGLGGSLQMRGSVINRAENHYCRPYFRQLDGAIYDK